MKRRHCLPHRWQDGIDHNIKVKTKLTITFMKSYIWPQIIWHGRTDCRYVGNTYNYMFGSFVFRRFVMFFVIFVDYCCLFAISSFDTCIVWLFAISSFDTSLVLFDISCVILLFFMLENWFVLYLKIKQYQSPEIDE